MKASPRNSALSFAVLLIGVGITFRLVAAITLPVGYDEAFDIAIGLIEGQESWRTRWFVVPVEHSNQIAPLWWLLQSIVPSITGYVSLFALRFMPILFGLVTVLFTWCVVRRSWGRRAAFVMVTFVALSDIMIFHNARGEFWESLLLPLLIGCVCLHTSRQHAVLRGVLWALLASTSLGKAVFAIGAMVIAELAVTTLIPRDRGKRIRGLFISGVIGALPMVVWLSAVQWHYGDRPIGHATGDARSVVELLQRLTFGYREAKHYVTGTARDASQVYLDARVWPTTVMIVPLLLIALIWHMRAIIADWRWRTHWSERRVAALGLLVWAMIGVLVVVVRGTAGARFHLLYLPALWGLAALACCRTGFLRSGWLAPALIAGGVYSGFCVGWLDWTAGTWSVLRGGALAFGLGALTFFLIRLARLSGTGSARRAMIVLPALMLVGLSTSGPLWWGALSWNDMEPMYNSQAQARLDAADSIWSARPPEQQGSIYNLLTHYYLTQQQLDQAKRYAQLALSDDPDDITSLFYLGLVYDAQGRPIEMRRQFWRELLARKPDSENIRARWRAVAPRPDR